MVYSYITYDEYFTYIYPLQGALSCVFLFFLVVLFQKRAIVFVGLAVRGLQSLYRAGRWGLPVEGTIKFSVEEDLIVPFLLKLKEKRERRGLVADLATPYNQIASHQEGKEVGVESRRFRRGK